MKKYFLCGAGTLGVTFEASDDMDARSVAIRFDGCVGLFESSHTSVNGPRCVYQLHTKNPILTAKYEVMTGSVLLSNKVRERSDRIYSMQDLKKMYPEVTSWEK